MARRSLVAMALLALIAGSGCEDVTAPDTVKFGNPAPDEEWGLLVNGTTDSGAVHHRVHTGSAPTVELENFRADPASELIAVVRGRALALVEKVPWTDAGGDVVAIEFEPEIAIPLTVWIVKGPFDAGFEQAVDQLVDAYLIFDHERFGIQLDTVEIMDATGDAKAGSYDSFDCSKRDSLESTIGARAGRFNVYRVGSVNESPFGAEACDFGSTFVAYGEFAGPDVLVHELGHGFGLEHPGSLDLGYGNVMNASATSREYFTEGQTFRAHVGEKSVINTVYGARPGQPVRSCPHAADTSSCPPLRTRIWPDAAPDRP